MFWYCQNFQRLTELQTLRKYKDMWIPAKRGICEGVLGTRTCGFLPKEGFVRAFLVQGHVDSSQKRDLWGCFGYKDMWIPAERGICEGVLGAWSREVDTIKCLPSERSRARFLMSWCDREGVIHSEIFSRSGFLLHYTCTTNCPIMSWLMHSSINSIF
jgi:hypothetical protein